MDLSLTNTTAEKPTLSMGEKLSYGSGEIASNLAWNMVTGFLLFYYSDVALLPVAALGGLMLVTRVLDAIFDPLVGIAVDRTSSRYGKARPYLLYVNRAIGWVIGISEIVGGCVSPVLCGAAADHLGARAPFVIGVVSALLAALFVAALRETAPRHVARIGATPPAGDGPAPSTASGIS
ncbi:MFS transporter [Burkholderia sp. BCC1972]|uniref:MFS transporter n=1 Tax=Burkholderia sp. BCC1972 TaxID=2817438 RepID=UPI002ABD1DEB|nr:MFS transporter [Burkholderia sp. BCC1972]